MYEREFGRLLDCKESLAIDVELFRLHRPNKKNKKPWFQRSPRDIDRWLTKRYDPLRLDEEVRIIQREIDAIDELIYHEERKRPIRQLSEAELRKNEAYIQRKRAAYAERAAAKRRAKSSSGRKGVPKPGTPYPPPHSLVRGREATGSLPVLNSPVA